MGHDSHGLLGIRAQMPVKRLAEALSLLKQGSPPVEWERYDVMADAQRLHELAVLEIHEAFCSDIRLVDGDAAQGAGYELVGLDPHRLSPGREQTSGEAGDDEDRWSWTAARDGQRARNRSR